MRAALLAVFLVACAAPSRGGREFHQSAFPFPAPPPAGAGAPTIGQPGFANDPSRVPRSPHARVLPSTAEPGIYAGDEPQAAVHPETGEEVPDDPILIGVRLPFAPEAYTDTGKLPTRLCAFSMGLALEWSRSTQIAASLNGYEKACLAAKLYAHCASSNLADYQAHVKQTKRLDEVVLNRARNIDRAAKRFERKTCDGLPLLDREPNTISEVVERAVALWRR